MGCVGSSNNDNDLKTHNLNSIKEEEIKDLLLYMENPNKQSLDKIWNTFDSDKNGYIDKNELNNLVYDLIVLSHRHKHPNTEDPKRNISSTISAINEIADVLMPHCDINKDNKINRLEFEAFGDWLSEKKYDLLGIKKPNNVTIQSRDNETNNDFYNVNSEDF